MARARRRFGQHFLTNTRILDRIADALGVEPGDRILEVGPGHGALTAALGRRGARITAIEIDRDLASAIAGEFPEVRVVQGDALTLDWHELMPSGPEGWLVTGNIPYNITSPLLDKALLPPRPDRIVFLVQREVADRVTARPGTREYGALTVGIQSVAQAERLFAVPAGAFTPAPRVDSAVIRLTPYESPLTRDEELDSFRKLVVGLFGFRRKQLGRALRELTGWPAAQVAPLIGSLGLDSAARPEVLSPRQFGSLHRALVDGGWGKSLGL